MINELRKLISQILLCWSFDIMPDCEFKSKLAEFLSEELKDF